jgi:hypothetical protein
LAARGHRNRGGFLAVHPDPIARLKPEYLIYGEAGGCAIQDHPRVVALSPLNAVEGPMPVVPAGAWCIDQDLFPNLQLRTMQYLHGHHTRKSVAPGWKV